MLEFYEKYRNIIDPIYDHEPPDFEPLKKALNEGLDINVYDETADYDDQDTLLSWCMDCYDADHKPATYLCDIIRFSLDHGYDVGANGGMHGGLCLQTLSYAHACGKELLDAARMLLEAGADPKVSLYDDEYASALSIAAEHDRDYRAEKNYYQANYYYAIAEMFEKHSLGEDYKSIRHMDEVVGKFIRGLYVKDGFEAYDTYNGMHVDTSFSKIIIELDDSVILAYPDIAYLHVEGKERLNKEQLIDCSELLGERKDAKIESLSYDSKYVEGWTPKTIDRFIIKLDKGKEIVFANDYLEGPYPNKWIGYIII